MSEAGSIPDFDSLPAVEGMPQGCAWGLFDRGGKKDRIGCLNLLTPTVVQEALKEAKEGISVSLNWDLGAIDTPALSRKGLVHKTLSWQDLPDSSHHLHGFDEEIEFNTQSSSQWDSLAHFCHQGTASAYNGATPSKEDFVQPFGQTDVHGELPTLQHWHGHGGMVGRGVLLDYRLYADTHSIPFNCFSNDSISISDLEKVAAWEGVELKQGDIIIVRSGYTEEIEAARSAKEQHELLSSHKACGVFGSVETAKWFWNKHPAAVASDMLAFEQIPPTLEDGKIGLLKDLVLHPYFLSLFGLHIGELWALKQLSKVCAEKKRYSFLLTSIPLNFPGAIASPPNALAIF